jgi:radical SAM superfamily enzyme YgiQ (UPF0313 family)
MYPIWEIIDTDSLRKPEYRPPIGLMILGAVLNRAGHQIALWDNYLSEDTTDRLAEEIIAWQPQVVGISCLTTSFPGGAELSAILRKHLPKAFIAMGGHHPTLMPKDALLGAPDVDAIFVGEGEHTFPEVIQRWSESRPWSTVPGVLTRKNLAGCWASPAPISDLDALPPPDWALVDWKRYDVRGSTLDVEPVFIATASRGCAYQCAFCGMADWNRRYRSRSAERVVAEIESLVRLHGARGIYFREDNFTLNRARVRSFCDAMIARGVPAVWECESRVDSLDRDMLQLMHDAGCRGIWCGVESGSQRILDGISKGTTVEDARRFYKNCKELGIATGALFMIGLPGETEEDIWTSYEHALELSPTSWLGFQAYVAIPKCALYDRVVRERLWVREWHGIYEVQTRELSRQRIRELEKELNNKYAAESTLCHDMTLAKRHRERRGAIPNYGSTT